MIHYAEIGLVRVSPTGAISTDSATIGQRIVCSTEMRVLENANNGNTIGSPTIQTYLERESADGFIAILVNQSYVVTESYAAPQFVAALTSTANVTSGETAKATEDASEVVVIAANASHVFRHLIIHNTGENAGLYSMDSGTTWAYIAAGMSIVKDGIVIDNKSIKIKRIGNNDITGVFAEVW